MTIVAIDINEANANCYADTKISPANNSGGSLTNLSGKILAFSYVSLCSIKKPRRKVTSRSSEALFCYAGSTLVANSVFAIGANFCRNMYKNDKPTRASLLDVAEVFQYVFDQVMVEVNAKRLIGDSLDCEFAIIGFCSVEKRSRAFHIRSVFSDKSWSSERFEIANPGWLLLGDKSGFYMHFRRHKAAAAAVQRLPNILDVLRDVIQDSGVPSVGGHLQWAECSKKGIEFGPVMSRTDDPKTLTRQFCGVNLDFFKPTNRGFLIGDYGEGTRHKGV